MFSEAGNLFQNQGERITVNVTENDSFVTLPCRPFLHDMQVKLLKKNGNHSDWVELQLSESVQFNTMIGFTLNKMSDVWGIYRCEVVEDKDTFVEMKVLKAEKLEQVSTFQLKKNLTDENASVSGKKGHWECCNGVKGKRMEISHFDCVNANQCEMLKAVWMHELVVKKITKI